MQFHALDRALLSRAGLTLQALARWFAAHPEDRHPTVDQLAELIKKNRKFIARGLKDLAAAGLIVLTLDQQHAVGRSIDLAAEVAHVVAEAIATATAGTEVGAQASCVGTQVAHLRSPKSPDEALSLKLGQDTFVPGKDSQEPGPMGDVLARLGNRIQRDLAQQIGEENQASGRAKLADLGHLEHQGRLPLPGSARPDSRKLLTVVGDLDRTGPAAIEAIEPAVLKMTAELGTGFESVYQKCAQAVALGRFTLDRLVKSIEEATGPKVRPENRKFAFAASAARNFPGLIKSSKRSEPAPGSSAKTPPRAGQELSACTNQSNSAAG